MGLDAEAVGDLVAEALKSANVPNRGRVTIRIGADASIIEIIPEES